MRRSAGVEAVIEQLYDVMRGCDPQTVEQLLSKDLTVAIGTDEEEWDTDYASAVAGFLTQTQAVGVLTVRAGSPRGYSDGLFGWFEDRALVTFTDAGPRRSGSPESSGTRTADGDWCRCAPPSGYRTLSSVLTCRRNRDDSAPPLQSRRSATRAGAQRGHPCQERPLDRQTPLTQTCGHGGRPARTVARVTQHRS